MDTIVGILGTLLILAALAWLFIWAAVDDAVFSIVVLVGIVLFVGLIVFAG